MQNTRLNSLVTVVTDRATRLFLNPWRRISLLLLSLLFGFFLGNAISTTAGQRAELDIVAATILIIVTEAISRLVYRRQRTGERSLVTEVVNCLKIGLTYSLFIDAFKLGS